MGIGRLLIGAGLALVALGVLVLVLQKLSMPLGRLPGDLAWRGKHGTVYVPIATSILLSVLASLALWLLRRR